MESAKPTLTPSFYMICCDLHTRDKCTTQLRHAVKIGTTMHPESRKAAFSTTHPTAPHYRVLFQLDPAVFPTPAHLYRLDRIHWIQWLAAKGLSMHYHIQNGGGEEWFWYDDELQEHMYSFLLEHEIPIVQILETDPYPLRPPTSDILQYIQNEDNAHLQVIRPCAEELKEKFKRIFLKAGADFRHNQAELWDIFAQRYQDKEPVCGIIQWPTGVGKTYAILMSIILAKELYFTETPLRGLLVAPQTSIFNTLKKDFDKLSQFGIKIIKLYDGEASSVVFPEEGSYIVLAMHQGLIMERADKTRLIQTLPPMNYFLYDELHHCGADLFHRYIQDYFRIWNTSIRLGTSATPFTQNNAQIERVKQIYGNPPKILHYVDYDTAIRHGWVAKPRFHLYAYSAKKNSETMIHYMGTVIQNKVHEKMTEGTMRNNKMIVYVPSSKEEMAEVYTKIPLDMHYRKYSANPDEMGMVGDMLDDDAFIKAPLMDGAYHTLFACQRYREGADIPGLELGALSMGQTIEPHILLQIAGRVMRLDYPGKVADILIFREKKDDEEAERIIYDLLEAISDTLGQGIGQGIGRGKTSPKKPGPPSVDYIGDFIVDGESWSTEKTTESIQRMYTKQFMEQVRDVKLKYAVVREKNGELGLNSEAEYCQSKERHVYYVENPRVYFKDSWISWYHFLGVDTVALCWPQTKDAFIQECQNRGVSHSYSAYCGKNYRDMPPRPEEMYDSWTDWNNEFGVEEELIL